VVDVVEVPQLIQLSLRLDPSGPTAATVAKALDGELPTTPCTFRTAGAADVLWLGPDEWLLVASAEAAGELEPLLREAVGAADFATLTDVSAQRTAFDLTGPHVRDVLAQGCAIDLHPSASPTGTCVQTLLAQTGVILQVRDASASVVRLLVRSSYAPYLRAWLADAAAGL
jgi:sarcosine oxidase subunit gamma